ncbi:MAG: endonuclease/exonuclease/phosphatase family protein [Flavobacteriales bacterium]
MKFSNFTIFFTLLILSAIQVVQSQETITLMTYNIKLDYPKEGENSWTNRKPFFINQLKFYEPDILGVQEAMPNQMKDMDSLLAGYDFVGVGRDNGKDEGEYSAIFYKANQFEVLQSLTFWLSETPEKVSMGWDAVCNRVCTYALFKDKITQRKFWVFNTHFDHVGTVARYESSQLIIKKINELNTENYPVALMGDFNMEEDNESIQFILKHLQDSKAISKSDALGPSGTFNAFEFNKPVTRRIDYIFVNESITVNKYAVLSDSKDCKYPSDHLPVFINISLKD